MKISVGDMVILKPVRIIDNDREYFRGVIDPDYYLKFYSGHVASVEARLSGGGEMKTAEDYADDLRTGCCRIEGGTLRVNNDAVVNLLRRVQADSIRAAAEKCAPDRKDRDFVPGSFWERLEAEQRARILFLLPEASK